MHQTKVIFCNLEIFNAVTLNPLRNDDSQPDLLTISRKDPRGEIGLPKTYGSNFFQYGFVQFGKLHSRCKAILPSIVLSQQSCEVCLISFTVLNP